jgi:precorrin-4 methylase
VIGAGPAGPQTATIQAVNTIKRMDVILATQQHVNLFSEYVGQKPVLFDPWKELWYYKGKSIGQLDKKELADFANERTRILEERVSQIKALLSEGKDVGLMDYGNPCLYSPTHMYAEYFDPEDVVVIPGMGCDAAAMAALKRSTMPAHDNYFVIQTAPATLMREEGKQQEIFRNLSKYPSTMIFYSPLSLHKELFKDLNATLPPDMPCAIVFWAGYPEKERILRGTIADMSEKLKNEKETFMGLLLVGRFLEGKPRLAVMEQARRRLLEKAAKNEKP